MDTLEFQRRPIKQFCPVRFGVPDGCLQLGWEWAAWWGDLALWILSQVGWTRSKNKHGRRVREVFGIYQKGRARLRRSV